MPVTSIPPHTSLVDDQFIQIEGPDGILTGYHYDTQQRALYFKESQVIFPSFHGATHVAEDPVPNATCDTPGLMAADDKCKLDALLQTRIGVLGFQGAGFADDGGWMSGDIMLAAGTDFISLERIGNVIRFTVDSPTPLICNCESCQQIFFVQDETDTISIRPPTCSGKLPGINSYGELKVYVFPESTIVDTNNAAASLNNKGKFPSLIFKRYDDSITPGMAELDIVLKRDTNNLLQTEIGWAFTPGAAGVAQSVWFMGKDNDGNQIRFDLSPEADADLLGAILYKGHSITKQMGVIVDFTSTILSTNQYSVRMWNVNNQAVVGNVFTAKNVWQYSNPENAFSGNNAKTLLLDGSIDILPIGTLVDLWSFKVGEISGEPINRYYFSKKPSLNPNYMWSWVDAIQFGDVAIARQEVQPGDGSEDKDSAVQVSAIRDFEKNSWGLTGFDDPVLDFDIVATAGTEESDISAQHRAVIDTSIPALKVVPSVVALDNFSERPVWLWNKANICNALVRLDIGRPSSSLFTPYDVVLRGTIDEHVSTYMRIIDKGIVGGLHFIRVCGVHFNDLPPFGDLRILYPYDNQNLVYHYNRKFMFPSYNSGTAGTVGTEITAGVNEFYCDSITLAGGNASNVEYPGNVGDVVELLHQEYSSPVVRLEFNYTDSTGLVELQFKVGTLDMSLPYENDAANNDLDDYVRGLTPGYAVSAVYSQAGTFTGVGTRPDSTPDDFVVYDGGAQAGGSASEYWNRLEIMLRDNQVWIWWNSLLIPPSSTLSAGLPTPTAISTPYFTIESDDNKPSGKTGLRLWPGSTVRRMDVRTQLTTYSEFTHGQLEIT